MPRNKSLQKSINNVPTDPNRPGRLIASRQSYYASNFPHPDHLERFNRLYPDAAKIIFTEFKKQSEHRQEIEKYFVQAQMKNARLGVWIQGVGHVASGIATIFSALYTSPWVPVALALIYGAAIVVIYRLGKTRQAESIQKKRDAEEGSHNS